MSGMVGRHNGDLRNNLLEATHKRRSILRKQWMRGEITFDDWDYAKASLTRWFEYRLAKLSQRA